MTGAGIEHKAQGSIHEKGFYIDRLQTGKYTEDSGLEQEAASYKIDGAYDGGKKHEGNLIGKSEEFSVDDIEDNDKEQQSYGQWQKIVHGFTF